MLITVLSNKTLIWRLPETLQGGQITKSDQPPSRKLPILSTFQYYCNTLIYWATLSYSNQEICYSKQENILMKIYYILQLT